MKKTLPEIVLRHRGKGSMRSNMLRFCSQGCSLSMTRKHHSHEDGEGCRICDEEISVANEKLLEHDHFDGSFLGWAHNNCNNLRRTTPFTPVFAENLQKYDFHNPCTEETAKDQYQIHLFDHYTQRPKKISLTMKMWMRSYTNEKGNFRKIYEEIRFVDSCKIYV